MEDLGFVQRLSIWLVPVLFAITVHEVAHGWVARLLGDPTAMLLGRLTLNPIKHVDPVGTIAVPAVLLLLSGVVFGWAKPVPVDWRNLRRPRRDMALVAAAGPGANLLMGIGWALVAKLAILTYGGLAHGGLGGFAAPLVFMGIAGIFINTVLFALNLLPLPPLDGGRVLTGVLPAPIARKLGRIEPYGLIILLALLFTGILGKVLWPVIAAVRQLLAHVAGIPVALFDAALGALF